MTAELDQYALSEMVGLAISQLRLLVAELRRLNDKIAIEGEVRSSATVKSSTRGTDLECKSYDEGHLAPAVDEAITQYARGMLELQRLQQNNWQAEVDRLERVREANS